MDAIPEALSTRKGGALDNGFFSANDIAQTEQRGIEPYIATRREPRHRSWQRFFAEEPATAHTRTLV